MATKYWIEKGERLEVLRERGYPAVVVGGESFAWSSEGRVPEVGEIVTVTMNGFGPAKVVGYFTSEGFYGLIVEPTTLPEWYIKQNKGKELARPLISWEQICVFGAEIREVI